MGNETMGNEVVEAIDALKLSKPVRDALLHIYEQVKNAYESALAEARRERDAAMADLQRYEQEIRSRLADGVYVTGAVFAAEREARASAEARTEALLAGRDAMEIAHSALLNRLAKAEAIAELDDIRRKRELTPSEADQLVEARAAWRAARGGEGR